MDNVINEKFDEITGILNIRRFSKGYIYLYEMMNIIIDDATHEAKYMNFKHVCKMVADKVGKSQDAIVRALRYAIYKTDNNILLQYFGAETVTPSEFIYGIAMKISCDLIRKEKYNNGNE